MTTYLASKLPEIVDLELWREAKEWTNAFKSLNQPESVSDVYKDFVAADEYAQTWEDEWKRDGSQLKSQPKKKARVKGRRSQ